MSLNGQPTTSPLAPPACETDAIDAVAPDEVERVL
jgi:hypothetical protein